MKPIRNLLLQRHARVVPHLDDLRRRTLAQELRRTAPIPPSIGGLWFEIFGRARAAWCGIGAAAMVAFALHAATPGGTGSAPATPRTEWAAEARREQALLLTELLPPANPEPRLPAPTPARRPATGKTRSSLTAPRWYA